MDLSPERAALFQSLEAHIGKTPLTEIENALPNGNRLFVKQEFANGIGHSHYDRVYIKLFKEKERLGIIKPGGDVFETTSGTAGVSFAAIGRELGYKCHVAIPAGGEKAREKAIEDAGAKVYLTPEEEYVNGFRKFISDFSKTHPDYTFLNHSMGNILGKGAGINENAIESMQEIADEIRDDIQPDVVLSALGNGTNTLGLAKRFQETQADTKVIAYEVLSSGVGYSEKYGEDAYKQLLDQSGKFSAKDFPRHSMPGTSFPGIDFAAIHESIPLVEKVVLVADPKTEQQYKDLTGHELPQEVAKTQFGTDEQYGRSTEAGISVARALAQQEHGKKFVVIGYDTAERYDNVIEQSTPATVAILGGQGAFGSALQERFAGATEKAVRLIPTTDKLHNQEIAAQSDVVVLTVQPDNVETLLREVSPSLKPEAQVVSFAAHYPLKSITQIAGRPAARGMADPWWNISAAVLGSGFSDENFHRVFDGLTKKPTLRLETDKEMDDFTAALSYAFVVLLMKEAGTINNPDAHLDFIAPRLGAPKEEIIGFLPQGNPTELLAKIATKGGVSESVMLAIQSDPNISPAELFARISKV